MPRRRRSWQCATAVLLCSVTPVVAFWNDVPWTASTNSVALWEDTSSNTPFHTRLDHTSKGRSDAFRLFVRPYRQRYRPGKDDYDDEHAHYNGGFLQQRDVERPTQTLTEPLRPPVLPAKSKILVLGASGLIGRLVVRQLLEAPQLDATIVALVRDYDKACRVLYDDLIVASSRRKGSKLVIVQGDLVPPEELPGYASIPETEENDLGRSIADNVSQSNPPPLVSEEEDVLQQAIRDCTTIISCLGTVRITNVWTDFLVRPLWRLLRSDVSDWCNDPHHPYYVHYRATQKVIHFAEREQIRRAAALDAATEQEPSRMRKTDKKIPRRIRFIRISDLCVAQPPWFLIPLLTNIFHSMVFRYQLLADRLLDSSKHLDTITIRPGDIVGEERNTETTALQVDPSGVVPYPARVGRDDTAELVVAAALWSRNDEEDDEHGPFHYTWACRWVGSALDPFPAQGAQSDGHATAHQCVQSAVQGMMSPKERNAAPLRRQRGRRTKSHSLRNRAAPLKPMKPYGICVAIPVYTCLFLFLSSLLSYCPNDLRRCWQWIRPIRKVGTLLWTLLPGPLLRCAARISFHAAWPLGKWGTPQYISF